MLRVDDETVLAQASTFAADVRYLIASHIRPIVVAPGSQTAREIVRAINRTANVAVGLDGSDAALLPRTAGGIGAVQTDLLDTLLDAGYVPVIEPTTFSPFSREPDRVPADDVAAAIAAAVAAVRALFFHVDGGIFDPDTDAIIDELTPAEALELSEDRRVPADLRSAARAAANGVRLGITAAQILDGRVAHAAILEMVTAHHLGTQVSGSVTMA